ncbi:hypothetical protein [Streptomyces sp. MAR4 CNX-425]|uniref:hypothetical protein n=1 Tax=Streptomyces sp. MAR4 CNX-425 TaxID=3406343 RepID=UPI003B51201F
MTAAELVAAVAAVAVDPDGAPAGGPRVRRPGRPRSRPSPGPVHRVRVAVRRDGTGAPDAGVRRGGASPEADEHLRVGLPAPAPWPRLADVLLTPGRGPADVPAVAARHPGALVVAVYRGGRCWLRCGGRVHSLRIPDADADAGAPAPRPDSGWRWRAVASAVHAWRTAGLLTAPLTGPVRLRTALPPAGRGTPVTAAPPG